MALPNIIWTVLPRGIVSGELQFSVFVSHRLDTQGDVALSDYGLGNWPSRVATMATSGVTPFATGMSIEYEGVGVFPVTLDTGNLDPALWDALFPRTTLVKPFELADFHARPIRSFGAYTLASYLEDMYRQVGELSESEFPDLRSPPGLLRDLIQGASRLEEEIQASYDRPSTYPAGPHPDQARENALTTAGGAAPLADFFNLSRFYRREQPDEYRSAELPFDRDLVPPRVPVPTFDFHEVIAALADHPRLLRKLGIVIDGSAQIAGVPVGDGRLRAIVNWGGGAGPSNEGANTTDQTPWTAYQRSRAATSMRQRDTADVEQGWLRLGNELYQVLQTDVDGSGLKAINYATNMAKRLASKVPLSLKELSEGDDAPRNESLPAQRNGGLTVVRVDRDTSLFGTFSQQKSLNDDLSQETIFVEDVVRGFRVDVLDAEAGAWRSLCQRLVSHEVGTITVPEIADEGYVKAASAAASPDEAASNELYIHESLFGWDNWSLVAKRPGKTISYDHDDEARTQSIALRREPVAGPPDEFPVTTSTKVLPGSLPKLRFGATYRFRARLVDLAGDGRALDDPTTQEQLETLGVISQPATYRRSEPVPPPTLVLRDRLRNAEALENLAIRTKVGADPIQPKAPDTVNEAEEFTATCSRFVAAPKATQLMCELHGEFDPYFATPAQSYALALREGGTFNDVGTVVDRTGADVGFPDDYSRGDPLPQGHVVAVLGPAPSLPYLPDPVATGVMFVGFPGNGRFAVDYTGSWPDKGPMELVLEGGAAYSTPSLSAASNVVTVTVPAGEQITVRYSTTMADASLRLFSRYDAMSSSMKNNVAAAENQHWMITPYRTVSFVHAVEKPVAEPEFGSVLQVSRTRAQTSASIRGTYETQHPQSTGRIELVASWKDVVDDVAEDLPRDDVYADAYPRDGRVFEREHGYDEVNAAWQTTHEFGDTKHRVVTYQPVATTRYREYFSPALYNEPSNITKAGPTLERSIPSSVRPAKPRILYAVPTFKWIDVTGGRKRVGRGLRVYMDRPWYSTGASELLGVLLLRSADSNPSERLRELTSEWGADPVYDSDGPQSPLRPGDFIGDPAHPRTEPTVGTSLLLAESDAPKNSTPQTILPPPLRVDVVGFEPTFSPERGLWFVDMEVDAKGSYTPFLRLAMARFQPNSVSGVELSPAVRAQFAQLLADRTATIQLDGATIDVTVSGPASPSAVAADLPEPPRRASSGRQRAAAAVEADSRQPTIGQLRTREPDGGGQFVAVEFETLRKSWAAGAGRLVMARLEVHGNPASSEFGWELVGYEVVLSSYVATIQLMSSESEQSEVVWQGSLPTGEADLSDGRSYRVVVRELELFPADESTVDDLPIYNPDGLVLGHRMVYLDTIPVMA